MSSLSSAAAALSTATAAKAATLLTVDKNIHLKLNAKKFSFIIECTCENYPGSKWSLYWNNMLSILLLLCDLTWPMK